MANLPEDIVDRIRALERQVHRLTTYVNSKPGGTPTALAATEPSPPQAQEASGEEPPRPDGTAAAP
ncbi:hypothetical protein [Streptomyces iranensis]|uniref:Uncharacterized protein n=1 Tax=Streptomyces iranensis TaxID=576784 RepID=A0A061ABC8_9ACTN|nr:hypothetical protein [Streptomyces iranensis]MBP2060583.1 hypothetical protein [Streptomyces iranensis]CDR16801.1 predicted protein [Streptomyces iranensis]